MKNQIALLVYPQFSYPEIGNTCALFRWYFDSPTVVFASSLQSCALGGRRGGAARQKPGGVSGTRL